MGIPNVEDRAEAIFLYNSQPEMWYKKIVQGQDMQQIADQVAGQVQMGTSSVQSGVPTVGAVQPGPSPAVPSPTDPSNVATQPQGIVGQAVGGIRNMLGV